MFSEIFLKMMLICGACRQKGTVGNAQCFPPHAPRFAAGELPANPQTPGSGLAARSFPEIESPQESRERPPGWFRKEPERCLGSSARIFLQRRVVETFVGIGIAQGSLDVYMDSDKRSLCVARDGDGLAQAVKCLLNAAPELIVLEADGGWSCGWRRVRFVSVWWRR
jgi:hypothetical protein